MQESSRDSWCHHLLPGAEREGPALRRGARAEALGGRLRRGAAGGGALPDLARPLRVLRRGAAPRGRSVGVRQRRRQVGMVLRDVRAQGLLRPRPRQEPVVDVCWRRGLRAQHCTFVVLQKLA